MAISQLDNKANLGLQESGVNAADKKITWCLNKVKNQPSLQRKRSCNGTRLFISVTRMVIGADWVTSR